MRSKAHSRTRKSEAHQWFRCVRCGQSVVPDASGTAHRNHCPWCLWSRHVDDTPGDRSALCGGSMEPVAVWVRSGGDWAIIHRCRSCGELHSNRVAGDDNELALVALAVRAISQPPFPLERLLPAATPDEESWPNALFRSERDAGPGSGPGEAGGENMPLAHAHGGSRR